MGECADNTRVTDFLCDRPTRFTERDPPAYRLADPELPVNQMIEWDAARRHVTPGATRLDHLDEWTLIGPLLVHSLP